MMVIKEVSHKEPGTVQFHFYEIQESEYKNP